MKKIIAFLLNLKYVVICLFSQNPNNPNAPQLYRLKKGDRLKTTWFGKDEPEFTIIKLYWCVWETGFGISPMATIENENGKYIEDIFLSDKGMVPYERAGWHQDRIPFFVSQPSIPSSYL